MSQGGKGKETNKICKSTSEALQLLNKDITKLRTFHSHEFQQKNKKNPHVQRHIAQKMTTSTNTQRQTEDSQSSTSSCLHAPSSSFALPQSYKHISSSTPIKQSHLIILIFNRYPITKHSFIIKIIITTQTNITTFSFTSQSIIRTKYFSSIKITITIETIITLSFTSHKIIHTRHSSSIKTTININMNKYYHNSHH